MDKKDQEIYDRIVAERKAKQGGGTGVSSPQPPASPLPLSAVPPVPVGDGKILTPKEVKTQSSSVESIKKIIEGKGKEEALKKLEAGIADATSFSDYAALAKIRDDVNKFYQPGDLVGYSGDKPVRQYEKSVMGLPFGFAAEPTASTAPLNVPGPQIKSGMAALADAFAPQTIVGPVVLNALAVNPNIMSSRASELFPTSLFEKDETGKVLTGVDKKQAEEGYEGLIEMTKYLIAQNPKLGDEQIRALAASEYASLPSALDMTSTTQPPIRVEPGRSAADSTNPYVTQTVNADVPSLTKPQMEFMRASEAASYGRRKDDLIAQLRSRLSSETVTVPDTEKLSKMAGGEYDPDSGEPYPTVTRVRTPAEVESALAYQSTAELKKLELPWWSSPLREDMIKNPEKYVASESMLGTKVYATGAIKEGVGARTLRQILSPMNVVSTAITSGTIRGAEAVGRAVAGTGASVPSALVEAREARGGKAARYSDDFLGDLQDSIAFNRSAAATIQDNFKAIGAYGSASSGLGFGLGLALDIISPPVAGLPTAAIAGKNAFSATRAAKAAGLITGSPLAAGVVDASVAFRNAWTWGDMVGRGTVFPGSIKILAAEDTGKALAARAELKAVSDLRQRKVSSFSKDEVLEIVNKYGDSTLSKDLAAARTRQEFDALIQEVVAPIANIGPKGFWSGSKQLVQRFEDFKKMVDDPNAAIAYPELMNPVIIQAGARDQVALDALSRAGGPARGGKGQLLTGERIAAILHLRNLAMETPGTLNTSIGAVVAFDAYNKATKAKGFAEFDDLVMVTERFIAAPLTAQKIADGLAKTPNFKLFKEIIENPNITQVPSRKGSIERIVQVIELTADQAVAINKIVRGLRQTGRLRSNDARLINELLITKKARISVDNLRLLSDANIEDYLIREGLAIDTNLVRAVPKGVPGKKLGIGDRYELAEQLAAKEKIFTPANMRSVFDGMATRYKAIIGDETMAAQLLDLPPSVMKRIEHLKNQVSLIPARTKELVEGMTNGRNKELIEEWGGSTLGKPTMQLSPTEALDVVIRGRNGVDSEQFVEEVWRLLRSYQVDKPIFFGRWLNRSFAAGVIEESHKGIIKASAKQLYEGATAEDVIKGMIVEVNKLKLEPGKTRIALTESNMPDIIGAGIQLRESARIQDVIKNVYLLDGAISTKINKSAISVELAKIKGISPEAASTEVLTAALRALPREGGSPSLADVIEQLNAVDPQRAVALLEPQIQDALKLSMPELVMATQQIERRAALAGNNLEDVLKIIARSEKETISKSMITGQQIDDSITQFFSKENFIPLMEAVSKNLPAGRTGGQKVREWFADAFQFLGAMRYHLMLYTRPGYHFTNFFTAPAMIQAIGGSSAVPGAASFALATKTISANSPIVTDAPFSISTLIAQREANRNAIAFINPLGKPYTFKDLYDIGIGSGLLKSEQQVLFSANSFNEFNEYVAKTMKAPATSKKVFDVTRWIATIPSEVANASDNLWRQSVLIQALKRGEPESIAQGIARKSLLDYSTISEVERKVASRFLLFYCFSRAMGENVVKLLSNPVGAARVVKQLTLLKDTQKFLWEVTGGDTWNIERLAMSDKDLTRLISYVDTDIDGKVYKRGGVGVPHAEGVSMLANLMYAKDIFQFVGGQSSPMQYLDPLLKKIVNADAASKAEQSRDDKLRLMKPEHVVAYNLNPSMFGYAFGELTPLQPTSETSTNYDGKEWQLSPEGYKMYQSFKIGAEQSGFNSTWGYWTGILSDKIIRPAVRSRKEKLYKSVGFGQEPRLTIAQQEEAQLRDLAKDVAERDAIYRKQAGLTEKKEIESQ